MVIQFLCPNGHRIHCSDERAGKAAKCPRCGVKFLVPDPSDAELQGTAASAESEGVSGTLPVKSEMSLAGDTEPRIEFLCPTGHHVHSPASLQGQPGQCPTCGARFLIPSYEEREEPSRLAPAEGSGIRVHEGKPEGAFDVPSDSQVPLAMRMAETDPFLNSTAHPMARLLAQLWPQKTSGTVVELSLEDGEILVPHHWSRQSHQSDYGLFALREPDGSFTLTAIAWSSIQRVTMRGFKQLPEELRG